MNEESRRVKQVCKVLTSASPVGTSELQIALEVRLTGDKRDGLPVLIQVSCCLRVPPGEANSQAVLPPCKYGQIGSGSAWAVL